MTIWSRLLAPFRTTAETRTSEPDTGRTPHREVVPAQPEFPRVQPATRPESKSQQPEMKRRDGPKPSAAASPQQTVRAQRAGYMDAEEAKQRIEACDKQTTPLVLVPSKYGHDLAFPDGNRVDHQLLALRHLNIFAFRIRGTSYYDEPRLRSGQKLRIVREPNNSHDPNAVLLTTGNGKKIGYVNKQRARWVARLIDEGTLLEAIILQAGPYVPIALLAPPDVLASLQGREPTG